MWVDLIGMVAVGILAACMIYIARRIWAAGTTATDIVALA